MLKKQNGITLIALIITIIVMLILVGVTINVALNGGLFEKAETAKEQTQREVDKETLQSAVITALNNKLKIEKTQDILDNLPEGWSVTGTDGEIYTCINTKTGNRFTVAADGKITYTGNNSGGGNQTTTLTDLEKYILGENGTGRSLKEISNIEDIYVMRDLEFTTPEGEETLNLEMLVTIKHTLQLDSFYVKYDEKAYKFNVDYSEDPWGVTHEVSNQSKIPVVYEPKEGEGEIYTVNEEEWIVLYAEKDYIEVISPTSIGSLRLGYSESATTEEEKLSEAQASYNTAITTINQYCKDQIDDTVTSDENVRSVGSASETSSAYEQDLVRMSYHGILSTGKDYYFASLCGRDDSTGYWCEIRCAFSDGDPVGENYIWRKKWIWRMDGELAGLWSATYHKNCYSLN